MQCFGQWSAISTSYADLIVTGLLLYDLENLMEELYCLTRFYFRNHLNVFMTLLFPELFCTEYVVDHHHSSILCVYKNHKLLA